MATTRNPNTLHEDKGKMVIEEPEITDIADLSPTYSNKSTEVIVYYKWTSKHIHTRQPIKYSCILLDKQGPPIQANTNVYDAEYFNQLLRINRISGMNINIINTLISKLYISYIW